MSALVDVKRFIDLLGYKYTHAEIVSALEGAVIAEKAVEF